MVAHALMCRRHYACGIQFVLGDHCPAEGIEHAGSEQQRRPVRGGAMMTRKHVNKRTLFAGTIATLALAAFGARFVYSSDAATPRSAPPVPQVVVSTPLQRQVDSRLGFLGQFSAIEQVELRAQVGGTLTGVYFNDGDIVHKGDLLFTIDERPYEIRQCSARDG
jgi:hypothetical protein